MTLKECVYRRVGAGVGGRGARVRQLHERRQRRLGRRELGLLLSVGLAAEAAPVHLHFHRKHRVVHRP